jgi:hypothetical protein
MLRSLQAGGARALVQILNLTKIYNLKMNYYLNIPVTRITIFLSLKGYF